MLEPSDEEAGAGDYQRIFDRFFVVSIPWPQTCAGGGGTKPVLRFSFPIQAPSDAVSQAVPLFCFPEDASTLLRKPQSGRETFSFVLTTTSSAKEHAYCRRSFRDASVDCLCIMSEQPSFNLFSQILDLVEERWSDESSLHVLVPLLSAIQQQPFPAPGHRIDLQLYTHIEGEGVSLAADEVVQMCLYRPSGNDYILDYISFSLLFSRVRVEVILQLFDCLVGERRIILVADDLSTLSGCATAACAMLNPFCWQHVFIPVLPSSLLDYCCAPMPFFTGVTSSCMEQVKRLPMEEVYMLNLSTGEWELYPQLPQVLPPGLAASLGRSLAEIAHYSTDDSLSRKKFDVSVARRFKYFIFSLLGSYAEFTKKDGFDRQAFLGHIEDPVHRAFATAFTETQMFEQFIDERVQMRQNGNLQSCTLLKVARQSRASMRIDPTELSFCSKCAKPLEVNFETVHGKPLCLRCADRKKRLTWKGFIADNSSKWGAGWLFKKSEADDQAPSSMDHLGSLTPQKPPAHPAGQMLRRGQQPAELPLQQQPVRQQEQVQDSPQDGPYPESSYQGHLPEPEEIVVQTAKVTDSTAMRVCHAQPARMVQIKRAMPAGRALIQTSKLTPLPISERAQTVVRGRPQAGTPPQAGSAAVPPILPLQQRTRSSTSADATALDFPAGSGPVQKDAVLLAMEACNIRKQPLHSAERAERDARTVQAKEVRTIQKSRILPTPGSPPLLPYREPVEPSAELARGQQALPGKHVMPPVKLERVEPARLEKVLPLNLQRAESLGSVTERGAHRRVEAPTGEEKHVRTEKVEGAHAEEQPPQHRGIAGSLSPRLESKRSLRRERATTSPAALVRGRGRGRARARARVRGRGCERGGGVPREGRGAAAVANSRGMGGARGAWGGSGERGRGGPPARVVIKRGIAATSWALRGRGGRGLRAGPHACTGALAAEAVGRPQLSSRGSERPPPIVLSRSMPGPAKRELPPEASMSTSAPLAISSKPSAVGKPVPTEAAMAAPFEKRVLRDASDAARGSASSPLGRTDSPVKRWPEVKASRQMKFE